MSVDSNQTGYEFYALLSETTEIVSIVRYEKKIMISLGQNDYIIPRAPKGWVPHETIAYLPMLIQRGIRVNDEFHAMRGYQVVRVFIVCYDVNGLNRYLSYITYPQCSFRNDQWTLSWNCRQDMEGEWNGSQEWSANGIWYRWRRDIEPEEMGNLCIQENALQYLQQLNRIAVAEQQAE